MSEVFLKLLNMSITAGWLILAVAIIRPLLKKAPKWINCALWALVAFRLVCPVSFESPLSLVPSAETVNTTYYSAKPYIQSGIDVIDHAANSYLGDHYFEGVTVTARDSLSNPITFISFVWLIGAAILLLFAVISYIKLKKSVGASIAVKDNIMACDEVKSPFILGILKPIIYVPSSMTGESLLCVLNHEAAHIKRHDHWWKPLGYLLLTVYWFNPLCWLAYILLCRDIETACDEKVIRDMDRDQKAAYSQALLNCNFPRRKIAACPLAFGEIGVKERVKSVLNYKKPTFWIIIAAVIACAAVAVCFMTNPKDNEPDVSFLNYENAGPLVADVTDIDTIYYPPTNKNEEGVIRIGYVNGNELAKYLDTVSWQKWDAPEEGLSSPGSIEFCIRDDYRITVYQKPRWAVVMYGDEVRYYKTHGGDYEEAVKLFYPDAQNSDIRTYPTKVAFVNWTENSGIYIGALNRETMSMNSVQHLPVYKFDAKADLDSFKTSFRDVLTMDQGLDETPSFDYITAAYDENFFSNYALMLAYVPASSGSFRFGVSGVYCDGQSFCMYIERLNNPEVYNTMMAGWFAVVEVEKEELAACTSFDAQIGTPLSETQLANRPSGIGQNEGGPDIVAVYEANMDLDSIPDGKFTIFTTYYGLSDGTWSTETQTYKYRLEITGRSPNAVEDTTYLYLSNIEDISYNKAMMAAGFSSNTDDYFDPKDAVFIGWK